MQHIILPLFLCAYLFSVLPGMDQNPAIVESIPEKCDNGIDDDGDGLIDLQDEDCDCAPVPRDYIPNPSFENFDKCPTGYSQMVNCSAWDEPGEGTPDFFHQCGFTGLFDEVIQPIQDGSGCVAFSNSPSSRPNYKEYVGVCLDQPLRAGKSYRMNFSIGFGNASNSPPTTFAVFGATSCTALATYPSAKISCPSVEAEWTTLGSKFISGTVNQWTSFSLEISPGSDIRSLILGGSCALMTEGKENYYYLDDLKLFEVFTNASPPEITPASGHPCSGDLMLETTSKTSYTYQWYRDGVAIAGATGANYAVPGGETGDYQVRIKQGATCNTSGNYPVRIKSFTTHIRETICRGTSFTYLDSTFSTEGLHTYPLLSKNGCDSTIEIDLSVRSPDFISLDRQLCAGESFFIGTNEYSTSGSYEDTLQNAAGCDSVVRVDLEVFEEKASFVNHQICEGEQFSFGGNELSIPGTYRDTLTAASGCDSVVQLDLDVYKPTLTTLSQTICDGEYFAFSEQNLTEEGIYRDTLTNYLGCDSIITLDLEVEDRYFTEQKASICEGEHFNFFGQKISQTGTYEKTLSSIHGCDSTIRLDLNVHRNGVSLGPDRHIELGESVELIPEVERANISEWNWSTSPQNGTICADCPELVFSPIHSDTVVLTIRDENGCSYTDQIEIRVLNKSTGLYIPNAFSPNGDGINDYFRPYPSAKIRSIRRMTIFNRSGQIVFEQRNLPGDEGAGWDGSMNGETLRPGVFVYNIVVEYIDGSTRQFKGDLTLLR